jgi:outer membrane lipoprotein-sorting protein
MIMKILKILLIIGLIIGNAFAQLLAKTKDADEILAKVVKGFEEVKDFSAVIDAEINMERVQIPKMHAELFFKKPDKVHFSSQGFLLMPREGVALNPVMLQEHYLTTSTMHDTVDGKKLLKLLLATKDVKTRLRALSVWVDPINWTIAKIETIPYEGRTLSMIFTYECQQEKYWLPSKLVASFASESDKTQKDTSSPIDNQLEGLQRSMPRNGTVTVVYSNYKINIGLSDEIFEKKEK